MNVCAGCGGAFLEPTVYGRLVAGELPASSPPAKAAPASPWGARNLLLHLAIVLLAFLWTSNAASGPTITRDFGDGMPSLMITVFLFYAGLTTLLAVLSLRFRFAALVVHAPALAWMLWLSTVPAFAGIRTWYAEATRAPPVEVPGMLVLSEWKVYRAGPTNAVAALTVSQSFEGRIVIESLEALRGDTVVGRVPPSLVPSLFRGATVTGVPFVLQSPDTPRRFRLSLLVYPTKRERPCRTGENGEPLGETPIQRLVLDTDARGVEKLGTKPHECGPLDTVSYRLMEPAAYPP